jgi:peptidoglycan-associated lipoprotein
MSRKLLIGFALIGVLFASACASHKPLSSPAATATSAVMPTQSANTAGANGASAVGAAGAAVANGSGEGVAGPAGAQLQARTIYFDFDSSEIKPEFADLVGAHARYLASNASIRLRLEGNTDERGSREYNIGLGERRAQAVRRALMLQGVSESQITTVSYGEERPAVTGHTEEAWSRNRRVELVYLN